MADVRIIEGPNDEAMDALYVNGERFALAYLDPPFYTQRDHRTAGGELAFSDKWKTFDCYLEELDHAVTGARDLLLDEGSLVLHLSPAAVHYVKVRCDAIFGRACFAGEIIWRYRRWPAKSRNFQGMHDVLLRYVRDPSVECRFNQLYEPLAASTLETFSDLKQRAVLADGKRVRSETSSDGERSPGAALSDVWEISIVAPSGKERTGYPTQKPERLIERLVDALTDEGDRVLDPFVGSGTTPAVCLKRGRGCVGIDASPVAIRTTNARLAALMAGAA